MQVKEAPAAPGYVTTYSYDGAGRLTGVNQGGQTRSFTYDTAGRLVSATNPENGTIAYRYDDAGNLQRTDARGVVTCTGAQSGTACTDATMAHDGLNRMVKKTYSSGGATVTYTYDTCTNGKGRLCGVSAVGGLASAYSYDVAGRIVNSSQTTDNVTYPFVYAYNLAGGLESTTLPSGRTLAQCYDRAGRVKSVTGAKTGETARTYLSQAAYDAGGGMTQALLGNGKWEGREYNERKQVTSIKLGSTAGGGDLLTLGYGFGAAANNGNLLSQTITRPSFTAAQTYGYDALNRVNSVSEGAESRTFDYGATGNMWVVAASANFATGSFTPRSAAWYDSSNRMVNAGLNIGYDAAGNQTSIGGYTFGFDAENHMVSSTINGVTATYTYDGEGRRVKKGAVVMVYDAAGQLAAEYGGTVMGAGTQYLTADHLGSTRVVTDGTGVPRQCLDYLPFGEEIGQGVGSRPSCYGIAAEPRQKFTGKERDAETGLDNFIARYYSPVQGRFGSADEPLADQDPADPQSWNLYGYVRNNPLRYIDPTGRECVTLDNGSKGDDGQGKFCKDVTDANQKKRPDVTVRDYEPPSPLLLAVARGAQQAGPVVNALAGVTLGFVAGAGIVAGVPAAASAPSFIPQIASFAGKQTARSAIASLGLPAAQAAAAISAIARATSTSSIQIIKQGQDVIVRIARTGANGYQVIESVIDQAGSKHVVQKAYDAANALVHYDPKK